MGLVWVRNSCELEISVVRINFLVLALVNIIFDKNLYCYHKHFIHVWQGSLCCTIRQKLGLSTYCNVQRFFVAKLNKEGAILH